MQHAHLHNETVECCSEDTVIVVTVDEHGVGHCLVSLDTVHDTLVQVCCGDVPCLCAEEHVGRVMDLTQVVE